MIKVKVNNEYKDVVKIFCGGTLQKEIIKVWSREAQEYVYESSVEYTGSLPITISANGDALLDYRIYGASGGVGDRVDITGLSEPLCGIQTYTDSLDLSTGILTRRIKNIVLTGKENFSMSNNCFVLWLNSKEYPFPKQEVIYCTHYKGRTPTFRDSLNNGQCMITVNQNQTAIKDSSYATDTDFKSYLAAQYAAGTPVTVWYVLAVPDVSTISIPSGLTGTIEGYLIQDGTPTPETPIYPTANGVKQADGTYSIEYGYKLPMMIYDQNLLPDNISQFDDGYISSSGGVELQDETWRSYGSKECPVLAAIRNLSVYIGENKLDAIGEYRDYVDYGIQKIARKIREYTFTGNETFNLFAQNAHGTCWVNLRLYTTVAYCPIHQTTLRSSHFTAINNSDANFWYGYPQLDDACNFEVEDGYDTVKIFFRSTANFSTAEECKAYFKEQYDNGTPVKIWFVMKYTVGQYESTDNGKEDPPVPLPEIPTIDGTTVIDYDGDPKPSQMYVKYRR